VQDWQSIEAPLRHPGTGRSAAVVQVANFWSASPVHIDSGKYILVVACERHAAQEKVEVARAWVEAGASYICACGPNSPEVEQTFDYASFLPELGEPLAFTLMTTSHKNERLEEALWFAFYNAAPPDNLHHELNSVVIVVDSKATEAACLSWVRENKE
jgi:hypothetical protein